MGTRGLPGATLSDVGRLAGVSSMTVSNVVNGRSGTVGAETRMRVESAISQLGYRPNAAARALKLSKSRTIGLIVLNESYNVLADPFIADLADGLCAEVNEQGYSFLVQGLRPQDLERPLESLKMQCDGLCLLLSGASALRINMLTLLRQLKQPIVLFQQTMLEQIDDVCLLRQDDFEGGRLMASYLLSRGARRVLMLVPALEWPAMVARLEGARQAVALCPDAELEVLHTEGERSDAVKDSLGRHLKSNALPDAIMAGNDQMAIAAHELLTKAGIAVPDQVRLTGFNAFSFWHYFNPTITTIKSPVKRLGALAAEVMVQRVETGRFGRREVVLPVTFLPGDTA